MSVQYKTTPAAEQAALVLEELECLRWRLESARYSADYIDEECAKLEEELWREWHAKRKPVLPDTTPESNETLSL